MSQNEPRQFDDPALKAAVKRACGYEAAPASLRRQVTRMLAEAPAARAGGSSSSRIPAYGLAAAAVLCIATGVIIYVNRQSARPAAPRYAQVLPQTIIDAMVVAHDRCRELPDHHLLAASAGADFSVISQALQRDLGRPVLATKLDSGWSFNGAGLCTVGKNKAGHLLFARGEQTVSLFSMPPVSYYAGKAGGDYQVVSAGHPIAGFATRAGLFCLVGYDPEGKLDLEEISALRDALKKNIPTSTGPDCHGVVAHSI